MANDPAFYNNFIKTSQIQPQQDTIPLNNYEMERKTLISPVLDIIDSSSAEQLPAEAESTRSSLVQSEIVLNTTQRFFKSTEVDSLKLPSKDDTFPLSTINVFPLSGASEARLNHQAALPAFEYLTPGVRNISPVDFPLMELNRVGGMYPPSFLHRRPRGEKRPIPEEQKDNKYYERRKRNNEAAKKSRDARKIREDRIAFRAAFLEQENSLLRAQVMALRDELQTMRQIIGKNN